MEQIKALLSPTNTGKTWLALERMQAHDNGMIGFPLRLLARENYDKLVEKHGKMAVALVTGEEKIIPPNPRYYCCTVEAMPVSERFDFVCIDEIQLCADPERGHVFTDRLLHCRGAKETLFLGAETMRPAIRVLVKNVIFEERPRLSTLTYSGYKKLTRLPERSAIVAFNMDDIYTHAHVIRRQKGGAAIVTGALSPRTRNAQVEMYQSGEVDYIIATDAIGMGLNMDIRHVALASKRKFDGKAARALRAHEIAQIAGRAGRHTKDGTFGITAECHDLDEEMVKAIENHNFPPVTALCWRNTDLDFSTPRMLLKSLEERPRHDMLVRGRMSDDMKALSDLISRADILERATNPAAVRLLWEVCQIPDFRKVLSDDHHQFASAIFDDIMTHDHIKPERIERQIERFNNMRGDVDTLMGRLAHIRTWTYLAHKSDWMENATHWQEQTKEIEDKLSDALHQALIKRFVDQRNALFFNLQDKDGDMVAAIAANGTVTVEGQEIGQLKALRFNPHQTLLADKGGRSKKIINAALRAIQPELKRRVKTMVNWNMVGLETGRFTLGEDGQIFWQENKTNPLPGEAVAFIEKGQEQLKPACRLNASDLSDESQKSFLVQKITDWLHGHIRTTLAPLFTLTDESNEAALEGPAKGIGYQLYENMGVIHRSEIESLVPDLTPEHRAGLRRKKIKMGPILVFMPELVKPAAVNMRALLWGLWHDKILPMGRPADGRVSVHVGTEDIDRNYFRSIGYPVFGGKAIRIDMLDRVVTDIYDSSKDWQFQAKHSYMEWLGCGEEDLYAILESMGFRQVKEPLPAATTEDKPEEKPEETELQAEEHKPEAKKELAVFRLKKGKISDRPRVHKPQTKPETDKKKSFLKKDKKPLKAKGAQTYQSKPQKTDEIDQDSPFAILQQLKK